MSYRHTPDGPLIEPTVHYLGDDCEPDGHRSELAAAGPPETAGDGAAPYCLSCRHWRDDDAPEPLAEGITTYTCHAFPAGIPEPIIEGEADHRRPYAGDHGIRFAQRPGAPEPLWEDFGLPEHLE